MDEQIKWWLIGVGTMLACVILGHLLAAIFGETDE